VNPKRKNEREKFYKGIKELNRPYQSESVTIKDEYGKPLMKQKEILNRWKQYFESLLKVEIESIEPNEKDKESEEETEEEEQEICERTLEEVRDIIRRMKNGKAPGIDMITVELIEKVQEKKIERKIYNLIRKIRVDEQMSLYWEEEIIYPICKKDDRSVCSNYRGIILLNVTY